MKTTFKCLNCNKVLESVEYKPFCSDRCKNIDLHKWFSESYTIPAILTEEDLAEIMESDDLETPNDAKLKD